jgi:hypothetical protein
MHEIIHEFTEKKISPWGGIKFLQKTYTTSGLQSFIKTLDLPQPGSNRGYDPTELIEGFITSVVLGSKRLEHTGMLRMDEVIKNIWGWEKGMASASTFSRFFSKFDVEVNDKIFPPLMKYMINLVPIKYHTIDIDSTVITRYGEQDEAQKGYNPEKKGRPSHHPLMAFSAETKMVVNAWMRSGDSHSVTDMDRFLDELYTIIEPSNIGLIRGDAGFYSDAIMSQLEKNPICAIPYIIRGKMTSKMQEEIIKIKRWNHPNPDNYDLSYSEIQYQGSKWENSRRIVIVRSPKKEKTTNQYLFEEYDQLNKYEFKCYVTNTKMSAIDVHKKYNERGDCENRIKELKYDYGIDGFGLKMFGAMEAAFRFIMIAFNIMSIFKQAILDFKGYKYLSTIKFQCIAIGSYLSKSGRKTKLLLSASGNKRHFLEHIFQQLDKKHPPYKFSNA